MFHPNSCSQICWRMTVIRSLSLLFRKLVNPSLSYFDTDYCMLVIMIVKFYVDLSTICNTLICLSINIYLIYLERESWKISSRIHPKPCVDLRWSEEDISSKGWKSSETCSSRIILGYTFRGMFWHAWPKWCWKNILHKHGKL